MRGLFIVLLISMPRNTSSPYHICQVELISTSHDEQNYQKTCKKWWVDVLAKVWGGKIVVVRNELVIGLHSCV